MESGEELTFPEHLLCAQTYIPELAQPSPKTLQESQHLPHVLEMRNGDSREENSRALSHVA